MKLFYAPSACSLSSHIVLEASGLPYQRERVDLRSKQTANGQDFRALNTLGSVPALQLGDGEVLTENAVIVQYIADQAPAKNLMPVCGSRERYRVQVQLNFIATEIHKGFSALFDPGADEAAKGRARAGLARKLAHAATWLEGREFLGGSQFNVADTYLFTCLTWAGFMNIEVPPVLSAFRERMAALPVVQAVLAAEAS